MNATINTLYLSFLQCEFSQYVGLENYFYIFTDPNMLTSMRNNLYWLILLTGVTVTFGLLFAVLFDRVS